MPTPSGDFHHPDKLLDKNGFDEKYKIALKYAKQGLPAEDICIAVFGIARRQYYNWLKYAREDMDAGFDETESNLIKLMLGMAKEDAMLHLQLKKKGVDMALDGNTQMLQFLLKTQYGYTEKTKSEVEITADDTPIRFEIVDMTPNEEE